MLTGLNACHAQDKTKTTPDWIDWESIEWTRLNDAIELAKLTTDKPRVNRLFIAKIDLTKDLEFVVTPSNGNTDKETNSLKTSSFLKNFKCDLAINAAPFSPVVSFENRPMDVKGLQVSNNEMVSPADIDRPLMIFRKNGKVEILGSPPAKISDVRHAVSGFHIVLRAGKIVKGNDKIHPRTAAGLSENGKTLLLLVVDGRQKDKSEGMKTDEVGRVLLALGCHDGINLDGGGTSTMVVYDKKSDRPKVFNTPIHAGFPGLERPSASHLGVRRKKDD